MDLIDLAKDVVVFGTEQTQGDMGPPLVFVELKPGQAYMLTVEAFETYNEKMRNITLGLLHGRLFSNGPLILAIDGYMREIHKDDIEQYEQGQLARDPAAKEGLVLTCAMHGPESEEEPVVWKRIYHREDDGSIRFDDWESSPELASVGGGVGDLVRMVSYLDREAAGRILAENAPGPVTQIAVSEFRYGEVESPDDDAL